MSGAAAAQCLLRGGLRALPPVRSESRPRARVGAITDPVKALANKSARESALLASAGSLPTDGTVSSAPSVNRVHERRSRGAAGDEIGRAGGKWTLPPTHWGTGRLESTTFMYGARVPPPPSPEAVRAEEAEYAVGRERILPGEYETLAPAEVAAAHAASLPHIGRRIGFRTRTTKNPIV